MVKTIYLFIYRDKMYLFRTLQY